MFLKVLRLPLVLAREPLEFVDRLRAGIETRWESCWDTKTRYSTIDFKAAIQSSGIGRSTSLESYLDEPPLQLVEARITESRAHMPPEAPFGAFHDGDSLLGRVCYSVVRALHPDTVVETGVCYGVTSAYLLRALDTNGRGALHSIDLPPLGKDGDRFVGWLIPDESRSRWNLYRGVSRRLLQPLLSEVGPLDLFIHDSLHTYGNMRDEFALAWPALRPGGVLIADDIEGNRSFLELCQQPDVAQSVVIEEANKNSLLGVAVKRS